MKNLFILLTFLMFNCKGQNSEIQLKDLEFNSIFAQTEHDSVNIYSLLGLGFFKAPSSSDAETVIKNWIQNNKDAKVTLISTLKNPKSNVNYIWLTDANGQTINEYLVARGCFPGGAMMRPQTFEEMSRDEQEMYRENGVEWNVEVEVDRELYEVFVERIRAAEEIARKSRLGIWGK
ncbi:MAG: hypothetical protein EOO51_13275 [Flavobacterium sp.]|nr:MAG: hypothetical protein EOO51_13275 [Flavobacterium sp.]